VKRQLSDHQTKAETRLPGQSRNDFIAEDRLTLEGLFEIRQPKSQHTIGQHGLQRRTSRTVVEKGQLAEHTAHPYKADDTLIISDLPENGGFPLDQELEMIHSISLDEQAVSFTPFDLFAQKGDDL